MSLQVHTLVVSPFGQNCNLIACSETKEAMLLDPGDEAARLVQEVKKQGYQLKYIMATHGHVDHISGVAALQRLTGAPFYIHEKEKMILEMLLPSQAHYRFGDGVQPKVDHWFDPNQTYKLGQLEFTIIETPGHTPGGVCLHFGEHLFVGDTLFQGSIGRTDLPGGNFEQLMDSIKNHLWPLKDEVIVHSGHGPNTTIGIEKRSNPYLRHVS